MVDEQILILRKQIKTLSQEIVRSEENRLSDSLAEGYYQQSIKLLKLAKQLFPEKEIDVYIPKYDDQTSTSKRNNFPRIKCIQTLSVLNHLASYIDTKVGNPVALKLLDSTLVKSGEMVRSGNCLCAGVLTRLSLEQGLRAICSMNEIEFDGKDMAGKLNDRLKSANIIEQSVWREIQAKLDFLNEIVHKGKDNCQEELIRVNSWVERFLDKMMGGT